MRETIAGLKQQNQRLQETIDYLEKQRAEFLKEAVVIRERHEKKIQEIQHNQAEAFKSAERLRVRNDALQWALYMAQMVTRSVQEKLDKCESLVNATRDKLSIAG